MFGIKKILKDWALVISMLFGIVSYIIYIKIPVFRPLDYIANESVSIIQPLLIFSMLFLTFTRVKPTDLKPHRWQMWIAFIQMFFFVAFTLILWLYPNTSMRLFIEGSMLSLICPTATAAAVVTSKLGGSAAQITTYTIIINLLIAIFGPVLLPIAHPHVQLPFINALFLILSKVFPLLIFPLFLAWGVRYFIPKLHQRLLRYTWLSFYIWAVSLSLAIVVTCKAINHSHESLERILILSAITLLCCIFQFVVGKKLGEQYGLRLECGQALGQKNTVFIIWLGYTFLSPVTAIVGGLYSVWHNIVNSYQLYKYSKSHD